MRPWVIWCFKNRLSLLPFVAVIVFSPLIIIWNAGWLAIASMAETCADLIATFYNMRDEWRKHNGD